MLGKLRLLLMPSVPARRPRLFETKLPPLPPVYDLLAAAEGAMGKAASDIAGGDRNRAANKQQQAEASFDELSAITQRRIEALTERIRMKALTLMVGDCSMKVDLFDERQAHSNCLRDETTALSHRNRRLQFFEQLVRQGEIHGTHYDHSLAHNYAHSNACSGDRH